MDMTTVPVMNGDFNLQDYDAFCRKFTWKDIEKSFTWNQTGKINIAYEAVDRHAEDQSRRNKIALIYSDTEREETLTFAELSKESNKFANVLKKYQVEKADRILLFMPRRPEYYIAFFGILKIGAVVGPLFEEYISQELTKRIEQSEAKILITTPELLQRVPKIVLTLLDNIILIGEGYNGAYIDYEEEMERASDHFDIEWLSLEDGMLLHFISDSTDEPKGIYHVHRMMIQQYATAEWVLDLKEDDVYWCTADPAWITGTSYGILAPWLHGVTNVVWGDSFNPEDWYRIIEKYHVSVWYTAPTALRMLVSYGDEILNNYDLSSLRHILSTGEPLNPEVITWGLKAFGLRIHDTWWMTETGAQIIANFPSLEIRPGSMGKPIPGINVTIIDQEGNELPPNQMGNLAIKAGWPAMMKTVWNNPKIYDSYFIKDWFVTGYSAYRDEDGYFWFEGKLDAVIHTTEERINPIEIERKLLLHEAINEVGVIGKPHPEQGEIVKAFITLKEGYEESRELIEDIRQFIQSTYRSRINLHEIEVRDEIPKTHSGKIMRHLLKSWG